MYAELFLDLVFDSRDNRTPSNVSKLPNHAMQDQPIGLMEIFARNAVKEGKIAKDTKFSFPDHWSKGS
jgi:hypothetical protein